MEMQNKSKNDHAHNHHACWGSSNLNIWHPDGSRLSIPWWGHRRLQYRVLVLATTLACHWWRDCCGMASRLSHRQPQIKTLALQISKNSLRNRLNIREIASNMLIWEGLRPYHYT